jgi:hypothetical protein
VAFFPLPFLFPFLFSSSWSQLLGSSPSNLLYSGPTISAIVNATPASPRPV